MDVWAPPMCINTREDQNSPSEHGGGLTGAAIQWGAWSSVGMAASSPATLARIQRSGMGVLAPAMGLAALQAVIGASARSQVGWSESAQGILTMLSYLAWH